MGILGRRNDRGPGPNLGDSGDATGTAVTEPEDGLRRNPDAPIECTDDDRLQRRPFARTMANDVRHAPRQNGFVIGLTGSWGEGKTSVINLLIEELKDDAIVVHFNPWLFSGTEQLIEHFFEELASQLREKGSDRLKKVASALDLYSRAVAPLTVIPGIGELVRGSQDISKKLGGVIATDEPSARRRAAELRERLRELDRPVLVLVDDLDRLQPEEIIDTMRLVRLVGDFPNLVYVLAYDQPRIEQALGGEKHDRERGRAYLEKMVQATHRLPFTDPKDISDLFLEELNQTIGDTSRYRFSDKDFTNLYGFGIRPLLTTVRDVRRYMNLLPATLALTGDEIELADVLALEAIRLFLPASFDQLIDARVGLTTTHDSGAAGGSREKAHERQVKAIVDDAGQHRQAAEELIKRLFPASQSYLGGTTYSSEWQALWRRDRRVAHPTVLSTYLQRRLPEGELPASLVAEVVASLEDGPRLDQLIEMLPPEHFERLLVRLQSHEDDFPTDHPEVALSVLLKHGQGLSRSSRSMYGTEPSMELSRVAYRMLRKLDSAKAEQVIDATEYPNLSSRYEIVRIVGNREGSGHKLVSEAVTRRLDFELADSILAASAAEMAREPNIATLVRLGVEKLGDVMRARVRRWSARDEFLVHLLGGYLVTSMSHTMGDIAVRRSVTLNWPAISDLLTQEYAAERVKQLDEALFVEELGDDAPSVREQALTFADDPEKGADAMHRFQTEDEDDERTLAPN